MSAASIISCMQSMPIPTSFSLPTDGTTGYKINNRVHWAFEAEAGFQTNPLVANNIVYIGNRDGHMYAVYSRDYPDAAKRGKTGVEVQDRWTGAVLYRDIQRQWHDLLCFQ